MYVIKKRKKKNIGIKELTCLYKLVGKSNVLSMCESMVRPQAGLWRVPGGLARARVRGEAEVEEASTPSTTGSKESRCILSPPRLT